MSLKTSSELENSVLEINHVTNVTKVLNETTASDRVSRWVHRIVDCLNVQVIFATVLVGLFCKRDLTI